MKKNPPKHLKAATRRWFKETLEDFTMESHHIRLFILACECWDRITQAREAIQKDGLLVTDRYGCKKPHPAAKVEVDNKILFSRLLRELGFDIEKNSESNRPPRLY